MMQRERYSNWVLWASIIAGVSYLIPVIAQLQGPAIIVWKGLGVGLLAIWAMLRARDGAGWQIALVMLFGAAGDVVLDIQFALGAGLFALGHLVAIALYTRHRRSTLSLSQKGLAICVLVAAPFIAWQLTARLDVLVYTAILAAMAATAWTSRYGRYRTGLGAMLFVASDLIIFARMGPLAGAPLASIAIWSLYYGGQYLIVTGVIGSKREQLAA